MPFAASAKTSQFCELENEMLLSSCSASSCRPALHVQTVTCPVSSERTALSFDSECLAFAAVDGPVIMPLFSSCETPTFTSLPILTNKHILYKKWHENQAHDSVSWGATRHYSSYLAYASCTSLWVLDVMRSAVVLQTSSSVNPFFSRVRESQGGFTSRGSPAYPIGGGNGSVDNRYTSQQGKVGRGRQEPSVSCRELRDVTYGKLRVLKEINFKSAVNSIQKIQSNSVSFTDVAWSHSSPFLFAVAIEDSSVQLWDIRAPSNAPIHSSFTFSPSKSLRWSKLSMQRLAAALDDTVQLWDMRNLHACLFTPGHEHPLVGVEWSSHSDDIFLTVTRKLDACNTTFQDNSDGRQTMGSIYVWDIANMHSKFTVLPFFHASPCAVSFLPNLNAIVVAACPPPPPVCSQRQQILNSEVMSLANGVPRTQYDNVKQQYTSNTDEGVLFNEQLSVQLALYALDDNSVTISLCNVFTIHHQTITSFHSTFFDSFSAIDALLPVSSASSLPTVSVDIPSSVASTTKDEFYEQNTNKCAKDEDFCWYMLAWECPTRLLSSWRLSPSDIPFSLCKRVTRRVLRPAGAKSSMSSSSNTTSKMKAAEIWTAKMKKILRMHAARLRQIPFVVEAAVQESETGGAVDKRGGGVPFVTDLSIPLTNSNMGDVPRDNSTTGGEGNGGTVGDVENKGLDILSEWPFVTKQLLVLLNVPNMKNTGEIYESNNNSVKAEEADDTSFNNNNSEKNTTTNKTISSAEPAISAEQALSTSSLYEILQLCITVSLNVLYFVAHVSTNASASESSVFSNLSSSLALEIAPNYSLNSDNMSKSVRIYPPSKSSFPDKPSPNSLAEKSGSSIDTASSHPSGSLQVFVRWWHQPVEYGVLSMNAITCLFSACTVAQVMFDQTCISSAIQSLINTLRRKDCDVFCLPLPRASSSELLLQNAKLPMRQPFPRPCGLCWTPRGTLIKFHSCMGVENLCKALKVIVKKGGRNSEKNSIMGDISNEGGAVSASASLGVNISATKSTKLTFQDFLYLLRRVENQMANIRAFAKLNPVNQASFPSFLSPHSEFSILDASSFSFSSSSFGALINRGMGAELVEQLLSSFRINTKVFVSKTLDQTIDVMAVLVEHIKVEGADFISICMFNAKLCETLNIEKSCKSWKLMCEIINMIDSAFDTEGNSIPVFLKSCWPAYYYSTNSSKEGGLGSMGVWNRCFNGDRMSTARLIAACTMIADIILQLNKIRDYLTIAFISIVVLRYFFVRFSFPATSPFKYLNKTVLNCFIPSYPVDLSPSKIYLRRINHNNIFHTNPFECCFPFPTSLAKSSLPSFRSSTSSLNQFTSALHFMGKASSPHSISTPPLLSHLPTQAENMGEERTALNTRNTFGLKLLMQSQDSCTAELFLNAIETSVQLHWEYIHKCMEFNKAALLKKLLTQLTAAAEEAECRPERLFSRLKLEKQLPTELIVGSKKRHIMFREALGEAEEEENNRIKGAAIMADLVGDKRNVVEPVEISAEEFGGGGGGAFSWWYVLMCKKQQAGMLSWRGPLIGKCKYTTRNDIDDELDEDDDTNSLSEAHTGNFDHNQSNRYKEVTVNCSVCTCRVYGLNVICSLCFHGGHFAHLNSWMSITGGLCAVSGCFCRCKLLSTL